MPVNGRDELGIMRLNGTGNLIWGKTFKCSLWKDTTSGTVNVVEVKEDKEGNIYLAGSQGNNGNATHSFVFKLNKNGVQQWDRNFETYTAPYGLSFINNELVLTGAYSSNNYYNIFFVKLDQQTGDTIATKGFTPDYTDYFDSHRSFMSARLTILNNGNIAVYGSAFSDLDTYNRQDTVRHSNIAYFSPQLDFIKGLSLSSRQHSNYYNTVITPDEGGDRISFTRTFYKTSYNSDVLYGTIVNNQVIKERLYQQRNRSNVWTSNFLHFGAKGDVITQFYGDSIKNTTGIEFIRLHDTDTAGYCTGIDTSLSFLEPFNMKPAGVFLTFIDTSSFVETNRPIADGKITHMIKETGCEQISFCNHLSIHTSKDTICANTAVIITASRNNECGSGVAWDFGNLDASFKKISDTAVQVVFKQPWQGKVYGKIFGCTDLIDSLSITVLPALGKVNLGKDTSLCPNNRLTLRAGKGYKNYRWNEGSSDSSIIVSKPGTYYVNVTNACGSEFSDTINISEAPPIPFDLGSDLSKCNDDTLVISAPTGFIKYKWSTADTNIESTDNFLKVYPKLTTIYTIAAEKVSGCFAYDSVVVRVNRSPAISLQPSVSLCAEDSVVLKAGNGFKTYLWSTGATTQTITAKSAGNYFLAATDINNCISKDSTSITVFANPVVDLPDDSLLCVGSSLVLDAGRGYSSYSWSDGNNNRSITVNTAGRWWIEVKDNNGCTGRDTVVIKRLLPLPSNFLPKDTSLCNYGTLDVTPKGSFASYLWSTGSVMPALNINEAGTYSLQVIDSFGCKGSDNIVILSKACLQGLFVPTAFTPNQDGKNDILRPLLLDDIEQFKFTVFNRWGQQVFGTTKLLQGWDGKLNGVEVDAGTFVWVCSYKAAGQRWKSEKGSFVLIR